MPKPGMGTALLNELYPPPPPAHVASPVAFGEIANRKPSGDLSWQRARHIEVMEQAYLDAIATPEGGRLIITVAVRHGKSMFGSRIIPAWFLGTHPDKRVLLAGHEKDFASRHGRAARDYLTVFGSELFSVGVSKRSEAANRWDLDGHEGGMLTLGVGGSPIGRGGDLVIVDDPYRNYSDAMNPRVRQDVIRWWTGTMVSRIEPGGTVVIIMARWHSEDLVGFLKATQPGVWTEVCMPALCTDPINDPLGRALGDPLWPERYPLAAIERAKEETSLVDGPNVFEAQFQQDPLAPNGDFFKSDAWDFYDRQPDVTRWCRAWDLAASRGSGDFTVGILMGRTANNKTIVADMVRGQWSSDEWRHKMLHCARTDPNGTMIELPQDPGQAGKDQAQQLIAMLAGHRVRKKIQTGSKEVRAEGVAAQQRGGNIGLPQRPAPWIGELAAECDQFPNGTHDDCVDALASAYNRLFGRAARLIA